jgi:hypothetical protein
MRQLRSAARRGAHGGPAARLRLNRAGAPAAMARIARALDADDAAAGLYDRRRARRQAAARRPRHARFRPRSCRRPRRLEPLPQPHPDHPRRHPHPARRRLPRKAADRVDDWAHWLTRAIPRGARYRNQLSRGTANSKPFPSRAFPPPSSTPTSTFHYRRLLPMLEQHPAMGFLRRYHILTF